MVRLRFVSELCPFSRETAVIVSVVEIFAPAGPLALDSGRQLAYDVRR